MGNCFSSPEAKEKIASVEAQAKAKGTETLEGLKGKLQGTGTTGQATAAQPTAGTGTAAAPAGQAPAGGAATGAAPATGAMGGGMAGIEGEAAKLAKAEEPKLAQEAKAEFTGAGGAGTTAAAPGTTPAGDSKAATTLAEDPVQKQVDATTQQAVAVARENQSGAQKTLGGVKDQISQA